MILHRHSAWIVYAALLALAPLAFSGGGAIAVLSQMGCAIVFGLSYNMLLGQGGMLSFGHAVYSGLGAFCAAHAMNAAVKGSFWLPVTLVPLFAGCVGLCFGLLFGYVTTRRAGTTFAMITLGIGELVFVSASMFPEFFGGDTGISTTRVYGPPVLGITFGPGLQAYYLIAAWVFVASVAMYAFTHTPLGRMSNAVRDNPERVRFIGYNPQRIRYFTLALSSFFAGIAGGMATINFEIVTPETLSAGQSGAVLLFTFIGGTSVFVGPIVGAAIGTLLTVSVSALTPAWPLYLGIFFVLMVKFAHGGIAGIAISLWSVLRNGHAARIAPALGAAVGAVLVAATGAVLLIEMTYQLTLGTPGATLKLVGVPVDPRGTREWVTGAALLLAGVAASTIAVRAFRSRWNDLPRQDAAAVLPQVGALV